MYPLDIYTGNLDVISEHANLFRVFRSPGTSLAVPVVRRNTSALPGVRRSASRNGCPWRRSDMTPPPESPPSAPRRVALPRTTDRIAVGETGLSISPICLGWVRDPDTIAAAFDVGIIFFFLSGDLHWP